MKVSWSVLEESIEALWSQHAREGPRNRTGHLKILWGVDLERGFQARAHGLSCVLAGATRSDSIAFPRILTPINRRAMGQTSETTLRVLDPWQMWGEQGPRASEKTSRWTGFSYKVSSLLVGLPSTPIHLLNNRRHSYCLGTPPGLSKHTSWALLWPLPIYSQSSIAQISPHHQHIMCAERC